MTEQRVSPSMMPKSASEERAQTLASDLGIPLVHPSLIHIKPELATTIPEDTARRLRLLPVLISGDGTLWLAMEDPTDQAALVECAAVSKMRTRAMVASGDEITGTVHRWYGGAAPKPALPPRRKISILELEAVEFEPDAAPQEESAAAPISRRPPRVLVIQGTAELLGACRAAFRESGLAGEEVSVEEADLVDAPRAVRDTYPFVIVVPDDVFGFDPGAFETLALASRALLVTAADGRATHLGPLLKTAFKRLFE